MKRNKSEIENEIKNLVRKAVVVGEIKSVQFKNKKTGEIATQIPIFEMGDWERVGQKSAKPKKPLPSAKFSEFLQYQIDLQNWKRSGGFA